MDPYEKKLRDEVLYLHNLWHEGPPFNLNYQNPSPNPNPPPILPSNSRKRTFPSPEWPVAPHTWEDTPAWPALKRLVPQATQPVSPEELARLAALKIQHRAVDASRVFFTKRVGLDSEDEEDVEESDETELGHDSLELQDGSGETEAHMFFMGVFVEDSELRSYYEKSYEAGEFCCLVCAGIGKKSWKRFKDCLALIQHSMTVSNTKKKLAHRAFGNVICKVLGWDIDRIPVIALKGEPLSCTLGKSQDKPEGTNNDSNVLKGSVDALIDGNSEVVSNGSSETCLNNGELIAVPVVGCVDRQEDVKMMNSSKESDADKNGENIENSSLDMGANKAVD